MQIMADMRITFYRANNYFVSRRKPAKTMLEEPDNYPRITTKLTIMGCVRTHVIKF